MPKLLQMDMQLVLVQAHFPQDLPKFGFGKKMVNMYVVKFKLNCSHYFQYFVKTNTCFPLFSYTFFSIYPIHTSNFREILGKMGLGLLVSYTFFQSPNPNFSTFSRKWSWTPPGWISICDSLCVWVIDPLSEGLVTPPFLTMCFFA